MFDEAEPPVGPPPEFEHKNWIPAPDAIWLAKNLQKAGFQARAIPAPASEFMLVQVFYGPEYENSGR